MSARHVDGHVELNEGEARAGQTGFHVRYILIISTLLVAAGLGVAALVSAG